MFLGLRTVIYPAPDLDIAKAWYTRVLGIEPYFDEPFYVGFNVNGYELALLPDPEPNAGPITYWGVANINSALALLHQEGATPHSGPDEVGDNIKVATVLDLQGSILGIIENPHFQASVIPAAEGPGR
jgi:catechol 2,3-dioxygenase-like lactoylglutathione lyase family enzyme